jgi:hypothetical protein
MSPTLLRASWPAMQRARSRASWLATQLAPSQVNSQANRRVLFPANCLMKVMLQVLQRQGLQRQVLRQQQVQRQRQS